jgi:D-alanine-D-alanine ligase-like ATP-grasp enzyme
MAIAVKQVRAQPGFWFGFKQHAILVELTVCSSEGSLKRLLDVGACVFESLGNVEEFRLVATAGNSQRHVEIVALSRIIEAIQRAAGAVLVDRAGHRWTKTHTSTAERTCVLLIPCQSVKVGVSCIRLAAALCKPDIDLEEVAKLLAEGVASIAKMLPVGSNPKQLVQAAYELQIPHLLLPDGSMQFGLGEGARIFKSTISDKTPAIGVSWAGDKLITNQLLDRAGFPVPRQLELAASADLSAAVEQISFPVVLKPADEEQGRGVVAGIQDLASLESAYRRLSARYKRLLLEEHLSAREYRINIVNGRYFSASERMAARVIGNGDDSIKALIEIANRDPRRRGQRSIMKPIPVDDEVYRCLADQGRSMESIPRDGECVRLRYAANVTTGGSTAAVDADIGAVNRRFFEELTEVLLLDNAGVDFICEEITLPFDKQRCAIIEVNAMPQFGLLFPEIFGELLATDKRLSMLPTAIAVLQPGSTGKEALRHSSYDFTKEKYRRNLRSVVYRVDRDTPIHGLPFPRIDALVVDPGSQADQGVRNLLIALKQHLDGPAVARRDHELLPVLRELGMTVIAVPNGSYESLLNAAQQYCESRSREQASMGIT